MFAANGSTQLLLGIALAVLTAGLFTAVARRSRRLSWDGAWIGGRLITHVELSESRWDRRSDHADRDEFESHVGGGRG